MYVLCKMLNVHETCKAHCVKTFNDLSMLVTYYIFISICRSDRDPVPKHSFTS